MIVFFWLFGRKLKKEKKLGHFFFPFFLSFFSSSKTEGLFCSSSIRMNIKTTTTVALLGLALAMCVAGSVDCTPTLTQSDGKSYHYDLTKLGHAAGVKDTLTYRDQARNNFYVNMCGPSSEECPAGNAVCMKTGMSDYVGIGKAETQKWEDSDKIEPGHGLQVTFSDGEECDIGNFETVITLKCDPQVEGAIDAVDIGECWYAMTVRSKHACATGSSGGSSDIVALVILLVLVCAVVLYFAGGAVYQKKVHDPQSAREYVIHNSFWCALPGMVVDGCKFIAHGCKKGDYVSV